jgi:hypothetical protein
LAEHDEGEYEAHRRLRQAVTRVAAALSPEARTLAEHAGAAGTAARSPAGAAAGAAAAPVKKRRSGFLGRLFLMPHRLFIHRQKTGKLFSPPVF